MLAFVDLFGFVKLSLASALMLWYLSLSLPLSLSLCMIWLVLSLCIILLLVVVVAWSLLQLGVLVLDDTGGDNRPSEEPSDTS